jgi:chromosomal replication initiation ATPase DnaA
VVTHPIHDRPTLMRMAHDVGRRHHATIADILGPSRFRYIVAARHEFWSLLRAEGLSYPAIAMLVGVDHSTVLHGCRKHAIRSDRAVDAIPDLVVA